MKDLLLQDGKFYCGATGEQICSADGIENTHKLHELLLYFSICLLDYSDQPSLDGEDDAQEKVFRD